MTPLFGVHCTLCCTVISILFLLYFFLHDSDNRPKSIMFSSIYTAIFHQAYTRGAATALS